MITRTAVEYIHLLACAMFLLGASRSYRTGGAAGAVALMTASVVAGSAVCFMPVSETGCSLLALSSGNGMLAAALLLEIAAVWLLFPLALICWSRGCLRLFHRLVLATEIGWVAAAMLLLYGLYWLPAR